MPPVCIDNMCALVHASRHLRLSRLHCVANASGGASGGKGPVASQWLRRQLINACRDLIPSVKAGGQGVRVWSPCLLQCCMHDEVPVLLLHAELPVQPGSKARQYSPGIVAGCGVVAQRTVALARLVARPEGSICWLRLNRVSRPGPSRAAHITRLLRTCMLRFRLAAVLV